MPLQQRFRKVKIKRDSPDRGAYHVHLWEMYHDPADTTGTYIGEYDRIRLNDAVLDIYKGNIRAGKFGLAVFESGDGDVLRIATNE